MADWSGLAGELTTLLRLEAPPIGITFSSEAPAGVDPFDEPIADPTSDGRTGRVPAGCVFWMKGADRTFTTVAADHGNCSVGSLTHGLIDLAEAAGRADVAALIEAGWVTPDIFPQIPTISSRPSHITYGPLAETPVDPTVVFLRVDAKQLMTISDAVPNLRVEGKPQCHIIPIAAEQGRVAASVGCALSRVRTGMKPHEMTCAIPADELEGFVGALRRTVGADSTVATYAGEDKRRFA
ncbi:MAG: DUF169 domain-containing protein [Actinomycetota bacterium]